MLPGRVVANTSLARVTMEEVVSATNFASATRIAVPLGLARIIVIKQAYVAKVETEHNLAFLACFGWRLHKRAIVA